MKKILSLILCFIFIFSIPVAGNASENTKLTQELSEVLSECKPEDSVGIYLYFNEKNVTVEDMPSWPDLAESRKELKEYYDKMHAQYFAVIFENIEYKEIYVGTSAVIVEVIAKDILKLAEFDIIKSIGLYRKNTFDPYEGEIESNYLYEDKFVSKYKCKEYYYDELYHHKANDGEIDWTLIEGDIFAGLPVAVKQLVFGRVITYSYKAMPFSYGYAIYDVKADEFVPLASHNDLTKYYGLEDALNEIKLGNPLGDADYDGELSVLDATYIQRVLAKLCDFENTDYVGEYSVDGAFEIGFSYISDIDMNGERNILDATAIQLKLAKIS